MLDSITKKRIDDLRNILVGKIPSPQSQVEQITTGLIYKFMYDMDMESLKMGGVPSFFVDDYEKYSWKYLLDRKLGGADRVQLYSEAIESMYTNPTAPPLFREIFKNSFLPFKDPSTLNMFLKGINHFHYSHSEKLGDAFEYLLSFMGSQGDAGQFRTPRHIIDFIVEIVNPQKKEKILDPACGTAGFLISSYKHILAQNTNKQLGDKLKATERKKIGKNLVGYDISPDMARISLVNMYLHQFASPQIHEYDTLSSEDRWNEYYDVILANPPFFSPKGGIQPHSRFGVQSKRAEVLFVDYIMEHLKPNGRAGIVVPEGIIFQTGAAYKELRKKLVENCLIGVVSLPAGVFQPYSGVKTSILILDKEKNKKSDSIFFAKVENDGFSLGTQRNPNGKSDLPSIVSAVLNNTQSEKIVYVLKNDISNKDFVLSSGAYITNDAVSVEYELVCIGEVCDISPKKSLVKQLDYSTEVSFVPMEDLNEGNPFFTSRKIKQLGDVYSGYTYFADNDVIVAKVTPCFENRKSGIASNMRNGIGFGSSEFIPLRCREKILPEFLYRFISENRFIHKGKENFQGTSGLRRIPKEFIADYQIPLPPMEVQKQIVDELDKYQKIIDGCRQVVKNYTPSIDIDPAWEMIELGNVVSINPRKLEVQSLDPLTPVSFVPMEALNKNKIRFVPTKNKQLQEVYSGYTYFRDEDVLLAKVTPCFENSKAGIARALTSGIGFGSSEFYVLRCDNRVLPEWVYINVVTQEFRQQGVASFTGTSGLRRIPKSFVEGYKIPVPEINTQKELVEKTKNEISIIEGNTRLIEIYNQKIQDKISKIWGG